MSGGLKEKIRSVFTPRREPQVVLAEKRLVTMGIGFIQGEIKATETQIQALEEQIARRESPEYQWLIQKYLPAERMRLLVARCEIPPDDGIKQAIAQGQINEIQHIQEELISLDQTLTMLQDRLSTLRRSEKDYFRNKQTGDQK